MFKFLTQNWAYTVAPQNYFSNLLLSFTYLQFLD